ncbi:MAG: citrate/2-methylcitrate synthase [Oscillospiraceae bacterium]|nr:citrate/2-methylcitrate synthase [Oscillospiraceae bacterium]MBR3537395.1 citrate/2-methylcitrate synthase [Oscillospiraceae bacterium]
MNYSMMEMTEKLNAEFDELVKCCAVSREFDPEYYRIYDVKRGLRDSDGKGVLTGLTEISDVCAYETVNGEKYPAEGKLYYQGYNVCDLLRNTESKRFLFEEITYLLLFGELPDPKQFESFLEIMSSLEELTGQFVRDTILKAPPANIMNALQKSVITLYSYDTNPDSIEISDVLRQSLQLICKMPLMAVYAYYAYQHMELGRSLLIRTPKKRYSIAENILYMLRKEGCFTELEARVLDTALVLHAEHGGGNNSTFTNHVVTSSGTDTYSATAASISSLKGPRHGGANLKVLEMFDDIKKNVANTESDDEIRNYLIGILDRENFDKSGLIYGLGHAVYTVSDPREVILKNLAEQLAAEKGLTKEFELYDRVERIGKDCIAMKRKLFKPVCANVDFYSGLVYSMLGIPRELFTPIFAISRISGWSAHRLEELINNGKIIRPAYRFVGKHREFTDQFNML